MRPRPGRSTRRRPGRLADPCNGARWSHAPTTWQPLPRRRLLNLASRRCRRTSSHRSRSCRRLFRLPLRCSTSPSSLRLTPSSFRPQHLFTPPRRRWYGGLICILFDFSYWIHIYLLIRWIVFDFSCWIHMESPSCWRWGHKPRKGNLLKIGCKLNRTLKRGLPDKKPKSQ